MARSSWERSGQQSAEMVAGLGAAASIPVADRAQADGDHARRHPPRLHRGLCRRQRHRRHRLDAHLQPGQDVDRGPAGADQAVPAPAYPVRRRPALRLHRHGLHEPQPVGARGPRVRLHRVAPAHAAEDRRRPLAGPAGAVADRRLDAGGGRRERGTQPRGHPLRRQHARGGRHRRRQGRGAGALRCLLQHLPGQRAGRGRRPGGGRRGRPPVCRIRRPLRRGARAAARW